MQYAIYTPNRFYNSSEGQFGAVDERRKAYEDSLLTKWHCVRTILCEEFLWDMRYWEKPKYEYTTDEIKAHILKWVQDHQAGNWTNNCGHCLYCIRKLLWMKWANLDEIANYIFRNNNIKYQNQIGTWNNAIEDRKESI